jgi:hypothetical protein
VTSCWRSANIVPAFAPVIAAAAVIPCMATVIFVTMVRTSEKKDDRGLLLNF